MIFSLEFIDFSNTNLSNFLESKLLKWNSLSFSIIVTLFYCFEFGLPNGFIKERERYIPQVLEKLDRSNNETGS